MFCNTTFWIVASDMINFEIKYPYMYCFGRLCNFMDMVIVKGAFDARYGSNTTCIDFSAHDISITSIIKESNWSILATFLLSRKTIISSATLLNRCSDMIYSKKGIGSKFVQLALSNCLGRGGQKTE